MSTTTTTTGHTTNLRPGRVTIATVNGMSVWFYIVVTLPGHDVYGVNLGGNKTIVPPSLSWATGTVSPDWITDEAVSGLGADVRDALASFLRTGGLSLDGPAPSEEVERARQEGRQEGRQEVRREWDQWKTMATEVAHAYADNNNLCGEFDRCMEEIGLDPRERDYRVTVTYYVTARNEEAAEEMIAYGAAEPDDTDVVQV